MAVRVGSDRLISNANKSDFSETDVSLSHEGTRCGRAGRVWPLCSTRGAPCTCLSPAPGHSGPLASQRERAAGAPATTAACGLGKRDRGGGSLPLDQHSLSAFLGNSCQRPGFSGLSWAGTSSHDCPRLQSGAEDAIYRRSRVAAGNPGFLPKTETQTRRVGPPGTSATDPEWALGTLTQGGGRDLPPDRRLRPARCPWKRPRHSGWGGRPS